MNWWVHDYFQHDQVLLVAVVVWVIGSIVLHELAHGWAAIWQGDRTPIELGHMTANPFVHIPPYSWLLFALVGIAWGLMPVNPARFRRGWTSQLIVSIAGPMMNLLLAVLALTAAAIWRHFYHPSSSLGRTSSDFATNVFKFLFVGGRLNLVLAAFNMLPVPPLDGSRVMASLVPATREFYTRPEVQSYGFAAFFVLSFLGGFKWLSGACTTGAIHYLDWVGSFLK